MKLLNIIKEYMHKARQEAARNHGQQSMVKTTRSQQDSDKKEPAKRGWIGIDLDGTLARSDTLITGTKIGPPVPKMINIVKHLSQKGARIKIFTARAVDPEQIELIQKWLKENELPEFEITNIKDFGMIRLYDDRAVQVITNTGVIVTPPKKSP